MKFIFTSICAAASIFGLAFIDGLPLWVRILILLFGIACLGVLIYLEFKDHTPNEKECFSEEEIKDAMKDIIKTQGKVCIMSRDLSWVDGEIEACLISKRDSVLIFAQAENELTQRLRNSGIAVRYYGKYNFEPKTRFTVIRYNRANPQVAIANTQDTVRKKGKFKHTIYETGDSGQPQDKWINSLAVDLIALCQAATTEPEQKEEDAVATGSTQKVD